MPVTSYIASAESIIEVVFSIPENELPDSQETLAFLEAVADFIRNHTKPVYIGAITFGYENGDVNWYVYLHEL